jgi:hypothetical protein
VKSGFANFVIQNSICAAADAGELNPALICDLANSNNVLGAACRAPNDVAIRAHVDFSMPYAAKDAAGTRLKVSRRTL